jgi:hypothetical protein
MMFDIRNEVEPMFVTKDLGEVYIIDDIFNKGFPIMFLGYSTKKDCMFTFNCCDAMRGYYVEYVVFETSFNQINRSNNRELQAIELLYEASLNKDLYMLMLDKGGYEEFERIDFTDLTGDQIPACGTYFTYNRDKINQKKSKK